MNINFYSELPLIVIFIQESQTNANLVDEYHSLYELQRKRLEATVANLTTEKDLWCNASYNLALKVAMKKLFQFV